MKRGALAALHARASKIFHELPIATSATQTSRCARRP
jgi:hypothetical protein